LLGIYTADELEGIEGAMSPSAVVESLSKLPSLPAYSQADFDKNLPAWTKLVANGKKSAADLLAMLSTKATFTDAQKAQILALAAPPVQQQPPAEHADFVAALDSAEGG